MQLDRAAHQSAPAAVTGRIVSLSCWTSCENMFYNCRNMTGTFSDAPNLSATGLSMGGMFYSCPLFNGSPNGSMDSWNTSTVTSMSSMFRDTTAFNQPIGSWNVSTVTSMSSMFRDTTAFNQPIGSWNVSAVTSMSSMFSGATAFNQNLGSWVLNSSVSLSNMLDTGSPAAGMSTENYSRTLIGWANDVSNRGGVPSSRSLGASNRRYSNAIYGVSPYATGKQARDYLDLEAPNWTFTGDALVAG